MTKYPWFKINPIFCGCKVKAKDSPTAICALPPNHSDDCGKMYLKYLSPEEAEQYHNVYLARINAPEPQMPETD
jgi:hypothetical protein